MYCLTIYVFWQQLTRADDAWQLTRADDAWVTIPMSDNFYSKEALIVLQLTQM